MQKDLGSYRKSYEKSELSESTVPENPLQLFRTWFHDAVSGGGGDEPNTMTLGTRGLDGYPKNRVVLLKKYSEDGFEFFTNYDSEKGLAIAADNRVCLSFFWPVLERQVIVKGNAEKLSENRSDGYFESRPEGSKLGALASDQSRTIPSREYLEDRLKALEATYAGREIPRPGNWGGFLVRPVSIEFWQGRVNRLHDRLRFTLVDGLDWKLERLAP